MITNVFRVLESLKERSEHPPFQMNSQQRQMEMWWFESAACISAVIRDNREGVTPSRFSRPDVRSVLVQVAIDGQIGYCFVVLLLLLLVSNRL